MYSVQTEKADEKQKRAAPNNDHLFEIVVIVCVCALYMS